MGKLYIVYNSANATTAAPVKQPTGAAIRTMLQITPAFPIKPVSWGCSFDASAAATPGQLELVDTGTVLASGSNITNFAAADVQPYDDPSAPAQTAGNAGGTAGFPLLLGTSTTFASAFTTGAPTEGSVTVTRHGDLQMVAPTNQYVLQWPLGREFSVKASNVLRIRATFGVTVNMYCFIIFEV